jgi:hypothetical protein
MATPLFLVRLASKMKHGTNALDGTKFMGKNSQKEFQIAHLVFLKFLSLTFLWCSLLRRQRPEDIACHEHR